MGSRINDSELRRFAERLEKLAKEAEQEFFPSAARELAARLLTLAVKKTPVGDYPSGSGITGGTLRRGWVSKTHKEAQDGHGSPGAKEIQAFLDTVQIHRTGAGYTVEIINPVDYAGYVESGHRTVGHRGWVTGRFMLALSEQELRGIAPAVLERKLEKFLKESMQ